MIKIKLNFNLNVIILKMFMVVIKYLLNISKISSMGWQSKTLLKKGLNKTYEFFLKTYKTSDLI